MTLRTFLKNHVSSRENLEVVIWTLIAEKTLFQKFVLSLNDLLRVGITINLFIISLIPLLSL